MRHILTAGLLAAAFAGFGPALPGGPLGGAAAAQDLRPVVIVNDRAITRYELDQRLRFMQALRAPGASPETAERALIDERLQIEEARRLGIAVTGQALQAGMTEFAARANMDAASFVEALAGAGVDAQTFHDFVRAGLMWREVIRTRVAPQVSVTDREVTQARQRAIETPKVTEVLISELIIPAPAGSEERVLARAEELSRTVTSEAEFAAAARRFSASRTAGEGGRLPWTGVGELPQGLAPILLALQPGQITQPLSVPGAVVLFFLRDTRGELRPGARDETVEYLRLTVASAAEAAQLQAAADTCDMLQAAAQGRPAVRQVAGAGGVPGDVAGVLARLDPDESAIIDRGGAADLVMLCRRGPTLLADAGEPPIPGLQRPAIAGGAAAVTIPEAGTAGGDVGGEVVADAGAVADTGAGIDFGPVPTAGAMRGRVFERKVGQAADALLAELRANAIIRRP